MLPFATPNDDGSFTLRVRAVPGSRKPGVAGLHAGALKLRVSAPPEDGKANKAIIALLADALGVRESSLELVSGRTHREKLFRVEGVTEEHLAALAEA